MKCTAGFQGLSPIRGEVAALLVLLWMSVDVLVRRRRFGLLGGFIVTFWLLSGLGAVAFLASGLF